MKRIEGGKCSMWVSTSVRTDEGFKKCRYDAKQTKPDAQGCNVCVSNSGVVLEKNETNRRSKMLHICEYQCIHKQA